MLYKKRIAIMTMATILASSPLGLVSVFGEEPSEDEVLINPDNYLYNNTENTDKSHKHRDYRIVENARGLKEDNSAVINNGISLLSIQQSKNAVITRFDLQNNEKINEYNKLFKLENSKIKSISNNGGHYPNSQLNKAIDGNLNTHWETGKPNSNSFTNEVVITLDEVTELDRIVYAARRDGARGKGFAKELEIYSSLSDNGNDFELVTSGNYSGSVADLVEIKFEPTKFKRLKFVFKKADQDWASASEIMLYKEDKTKDKVKRLFTSYAMTELNPEFNSLDKIEELEKETKNHPLYQLFVPYIEDAKDIILDQIKDIKTVVAEQQGDRDAHSWNNLKMRFGNNHQPTGILALPGDTITVYVDVEPGKPVPSLLFSQQEGSWSSWARTVQLKPGRNDIVVPKVEQDKWYGHSVTPGGPIYIINPYTPEQQGKAPTLRFAKGVQKFPIYDKNTNEEDFLQFLKDYKKKVDEDAAKNPNVMDRKMIDVVEIVSDHMVLTVTTGGAYETYINQGFKPSQTVKMYNDHLKMLFDYLGLDGRSEKHDIKYSRQNIRLAQPYGYMYAAGNHIGVQKDVMSSLLTSVNGWGINHEIGHNTDIDALTISEVLNNMLPQYVSYKYGTLDERIPFESEVYKNIIKLDNNKYTDGGLFEKIAPFWQLEMVYPGYWGKLNGIYRENDIRVKDENDKLDKMVYYSSMALELDLSEFFERHGFPVSENTKEFTKKYQKPEKKIWYSNYEFIKYTGEGFKNDPNLQVIKSKQGDNIKLSFNVDDSCKGDVLGYEIYKNGEVIAFTSTNSFVDKSTTLDENVTYKVVPFDKKLNEGKAVEFSSYAPTLRLSQNNLTLKLGQNFDPKDIVEAYNYKGENISEFIKIDGSVDTNKKGNYQVTYTVTDDNFTSQKTLNVEVVTDYVYITDLFWESARTDYGTVNKDSSSTNRDIKLTINGSNTSFKKGIGTHANSEIVYDLTDQNYEYFETYIGVDKNISEQDRSSIIFKILADGKEIYNSGVMNYNSEAKKVRVPISGVKKLELIINDASNGNASDHGSWGEAKLITNSDDPILTIPRSISTKVGEKIDLNQAFTAIDPQDGDITDKVEVSGDVDFNKVGKYDITYKVTDNDGNQVIKTRNVAVVDMKDYKYLTEYDWVSTQNGYVEPVKDKATSYNPLRLTGSDGKGVVYEKGIGAHSTSTITYDLTDKDFAYFTSYVGVDRQMYGSIGSVSFEVYVDGVKKFDSGLMNSTDEQKYVEVDINGAKELKLVVTDGGNGNGSDHASWGDTKLHFVNPKEEVVETEVRKDLKKLVEYAETITKDMVGATNHIEKRWENFTKELENAKNVLKDVNSTDEQMKNSKVMLEYVISELYLKEEVTETQVRKELKELVEYAETITKDMVGATNHIEKRWENFTKELENAKNILKNVNSTDEQMENSKAMLEYVISELYLKEEVAETQAKKELKELVEYAETITKDMVGATNHIEKRWENFTKELENAKNVLKNVNSTDEQMKNSKAMLEYYLGELYIR